MYNFISKSLGQGVKPRQINRERYGYCTSIHHFFQFTRSPGAHVISDSEHQVYNLLWRKVGRHIVPRAVEGLDDVVNAADYIQVGSRNSIFTSADVVVN